MGGLMRQSVSGKVPPAVVDLAGVDGVQQEQETWMALFQPQVCPDLHRAVVPKAGQAVVFVRVFCRNDPFFGPESLEFISTCPLSCLDREDPAG